MTRGLRRCFEAMYCLNCFRFWIWVGSLFCTAQYNIPLKVLIYFIGY